MTKLQLVLLILAATLIGRSSVYQNTFRFNLAKYEQGTEVNPYQGRYMFSPILRWASHNATLAKAANLLHESSRGPEDLLMQIVNVACLIALCFLAVRIRNRFAPQMLLPWLAPWLVLWITACMYVMRNEHALYYPYDLPGVLFFTIGLVACLEYRPILLLLVLAVGSFNRETTVFLLPIWIACHYDRVQPSNKLRVGAIAVFGFALWAAARLTIRHWIGNVPTIEGFRGRINMHFLLLPHHWPQVATVGGFLVVPMLLRRDLVRDKLLVRAWLGFIPFLLAATAFGWWDQTRIYGETNVLVAVTAALQFEQYLRNHAAELSKPKP